MEIHGLEQDMAKLFALLPEREKRVAGASPALELSDPVAELSRRLHPESFLMEITAVREETPTTRTFRFTAAPGSPAPLPCFRAGQYLSLKVTVEGVRITRPFSISSAPADVCPRASSFYEITVRRKEGGFLTLYLWERWRAGTVVEASGPHGSFYHEPARDAGHIVALAGGSGITPFRSMIREMAAGAERGAEAGAAAGAASGPGAGARSGEADLRLTLLYGSRTASGIIFKEELDELAARLPGRLQVVHILSDDPGWPGRKGFIDASLIRAEVGDLRDKTFFISGPRAMHLYLEGELQALGVPGRRVRRELPGAAEEISAGPDYPFAARGKVFRITVHTRGGSTVELPAAAEETVLVSLERAGLAPDSQCRSGECGFCRSHLLSGDIYGRKDGDGRRAADRLLGFIHPCAAFPLSDLQLRVP